MGSRESDMAERLSLAHVDLRIFFVSFLLSFTLLSSPLSLFQPPHSGTKESNTPVNILEYEKGLSACCNYSE